MKKHVALIAPNWPLHLETMYDFSCENLALAYLAKSFLDSNWECTVVDGYLLNLDAESVANSILNSGKNPSLICISTTQQTLTECKAICQALKVGGYDGSIIVGGWGVSSCAEQARKFFGPSITVWPEFDAHVFASHISGSDHSNLENASEQHRFSRNSPTSLTESIYLPLDQWPFPYHYALNDEQYANCRAMPCPILSSIGCSWGRCSFCSTAARWQGQYLHRPGANIVEEMYLCAQLYGSDNFSFVDDNFLSGPDGVIKTRQLIAALRRKQLKCEFSVDLRLREYDLRLLDDLRTVGLRKVFIGIESAETPVLKRFNKPSYGLKYVHDELSSLRDSGLEVEIGYITFEPFMRVDEAMGAVQFLINEFPNDAIWRMTTRLQMFCGTKIFQSVSEAGLLQGEFPDYTFRFMDPDTEKLYSILKNLKKLR
jgi:hypothetical protein